MNRFVSNLILGLFVLVLVVVYGVAKQPAIYSLTAPGAKLDDEQLTNSEHVVFPSGQVIQVTLATTDEQRQAGLSSYENLAKDAGMLFVFPAVGEYGIWMQGMSFALDILWLNESGEVVHIVEDAPVPEADEDLTIYRNNQPARYVLELAAGTIEEAEIVVGEQLTLQV